jgi:hypothetical protein
MRKVKAPNLCAGSYFHDDIKNENIFEEVRVVPLERAGSTARRDCGCKTNLANESSMTKHGFVSYIFMLSAEFISQNQKSI